MFRKLLAPWGVFCSVFPSLCLVLAVGLAMPAYGGDYDDDDGDGLRDGEELRDLDGDGILDFTDFDGDGIWDVHDVDDDGDGVPSNYEKVDADNDGIPDYMDPDSFGTYNAMADEPDCEEGMLPDGSPGQEYCVDRDCDGIVDAEESRQEFYVSG